MELIYYILFATIFLFILLFFFFIFIVIKSSKDYRKHQFIINVISSQRQKITKSSQELTITDQERIYDEPAQNPRGNLDFKNLLSKNISGKDMHAGGSEKMDWFEKETFNPEKSFDPQTEEKSDSELLKAQELELKEQILRLKDINKKQQELLIDLKEEKKALQASLSLGQGFLTPDLSSKEAKIDELNMEIAELQSAYNALKLKYAQVQSSYESLERQAVIDMQTKDQEISANKTYIESLENNTAVLNENIKALGARLARFQADKDIIGEKEKEIIFLKQEMEILGKKLENNSSLEADLGRKNQEIRDLSFKVKSLNEKLSQAHIENVSYGLKAKEIDLLKEKISSLSEQFKSRENHEHSVRDKELEIKNLKQAREDLTQELIRAYVDKEKFLSQSEDITAQKQQINFFTAELKIKAKLEESLKEKEDGLVNLSKRYQFLEQELKAVKEEKALSLQKAIKTEDLVKKLNDEINSLKEEIEKKDRLLDQKKIFLDDLLKKHRELEEGLRQNKADKEIISNQIREISGLNRDLKSAREKLEKLQQDQDKESASRLDELTVEIEANSKKAKEFEDLEERLVIFKEQCLGYKSRNSQLTREHQLKIGEKELQLQNLARELQELKNTNKELEKNIEELKKQKPKTKTQEDPPDGKGVYSIWSEAVDGFKKSADKSKNSHPQKIRPEVKDILLKDIQKLKMELEIIRAENEHLKDKLLGN
ncbi:MAG: hypothetical protein JW867_04495 [Candidatus Omnitrophica bacterium]|nr:hypothetical protein [Candidatus Omnitrophota bacterium]